MPDLPVDIDATYPDDAERPDRKLHQQHHDALHERYNEENVATRECFDLADFGADPTGATEIGPAMQAAVDAIAATPRQTGKICVGPGYYLWRTEVDFSEVGNLEIEGPRSVLRSFDLYSSGAHFISDQSPFTMFRLASSSIGNAQMVTLRNLSCIISSFNLTTSENNSPGDCKIIGYDLDSGYGVDLVCVDCDFSTPSGFFNPEDIFTNLPATSPVVEVGSYELATFVRTRIAGGTGGIDVIGYGIDVEHLELDRCRIIGAYGVRITDSEGTGVGVLLISRSQFGTFFNGSPDGSPQIEVDVAFGGGVDSGRIINNVFYSAYPIKVTAPYGTFTINDNVSLYGHIFDPAIYFDGGASGRALIADNHLWSTGSPDPTEPGIVIAGGNYNKVTGNLVHGYDYGASVHAAATNTNVSGNTLHGLTGDLLDAGTGTYVNGNQP